MTGQSGSASGPEPYSSSPIFTETSLPAALRSRHTTKDGVWGVLRVFEGQVKFTALEPPSETIVSAGQSHLILPQQPHFVEPLGAMKMRVDFFREQPRV